MSDGADKRVHPRLSLDGSFTARFELEGVVYRGVSLTNISVGGIGISMDVGAAKDILLGILLRNLVIEQPPFPTIRADAVVRHVLGRHAGRVSGDLFLGLQFVDPPLGLVLQIEAFIEKRIEG
jgi:hypothetical protein